MSAKPWKNPLEKLLSIIRDRRRNSTEEAIDKIEATIEQLKEEAAELETQGAWATAGEGREERIEGEQLSKQAARLRTHIEHLEARKLALILRL